MVEIMCTLTPGQVFGNEQTVRQMCAAGMQSVRLNTAHVTSCDELARIARRIKEINPSLKVLIDTKGPEMRTTAGEITLAEGDKVTVEGTDTDMPTNGNVIHVNYPLIHKAVKKGDHLLIDDGRIILETENIDGTKILANVRRGGFLGARKGLAVKDVDVPLPAVSDHDRAYIAQARESADIDIIAHSFVRSAADVRAVRAVAESKKPLIAKIENQQGLDNLEEIVKEADALLIARGDLTASIGKENVPVAQQKIATAAKRAGKPVYLATNILPSLMRGEKVSAEDLEGIETAMRQGVDVMLLTNETAVGPRPVESVENLKFRMNSMENLKFRI